MKAGVSEIVLCGDLDVGQAPISGLFYQRQRKLYLKYHWCQFGARCRVAFHAFHHELGHALQSAEWGNGHYDWPEWEAVNPPGFHYGGGGVMELMEDPEKNWATWSNDQPGFLNAYSTTAPWEDRSEIMAALMNNGDRAFLRDYYLRDPIIQKKVDLMAHLLSEFCGPNQANYFWERAIDSLKTQPEVSSASNRSQSPLKVDLQKAIGGDLIDASGNPVAFETLEGKKYFLLYFSASWCSHCRQFMPQFLEYYRNTKYHDEFEVVFVREPLIKWERHLLHSKEAAGKAATQEHPSWAVTAEPTQPPASFQCNPEGWKRLGRFSALLARARPLRVLPLRSRLEKRPNRFQQMPLPFNQWFLSSDQDESQMLSYLQEMPWKAVRFNSPGESFLKTNYSRGPGIPTLALVNSDGRLLCFRKGFAKNYDFGVDKMLDILNQKLSLPPNNTAPEPTANGLSASTIK